MLSKKLICDTFLKFNNCRILSLGDLMVDVEIYGSVNRISSEAPVIIVDEKYKNNKLGGSANVVSNIIAFGGKVIPCGVVGNDIYGNFIKQEINNLSELNNILIDDSRPTTTKTRIFSSHQQVFRIDKESKIPINENIQLLILDYIKKHIHDFSGIIISDYNKGVLEYNFIQDVINFCRENNKLIFVDPKTGYYKYKNSNFITPNLNELSIMCNKTINNDDDIYSFGMKVYKDLNLDGLIITRSEDGISIIRNSGHKMITLPTRSKDVSNVVGAGDTVISTFALSYLSGLSMEESAELANLAAGVVVGKVGTATATLDEILEIMGS
jgi:D-beta-D-heptose 7-phosphate kinase/D-beta-D-heptose 1-phosphate adenosyltransferase